MNILHIDSSFNHAHSVSRLLSREIVDRLMQSGRYDEVVYRDVVDDEISHLTAPIAAGFRPVAESDLSADVAVEHRLTEALVAEFLASDLIVIGAPMYNFSIPSQLKAWLDRLAQPGKTFSYTAQGPVGLAGDKRVIIASSRGGFYHDTPLAEMDFQERYLNAFFGFLGITNVAFVRAEGISKGDAVKEREIQRAIASVADVINL
ncbi:FMN-dependent NADH-azoreductase [Kosakonia sp. HypNH10]|uniref:FMN-dependent NADH-azoreductase n=1 Tax=Kosakonia sp. HypNH10 TaxID=2980101 RepID=UPI00244BFB87|nr:FMN-dependent NADH-azoreductase [Kosakonia sp. HypNH10]MDH2912681.1 FMN-dependent NADH-azoreductase [Kosakonia sp. HypNH10]